MVAHRDSVERLTDALHRLAAQHGVRTRPVGTLGGRN
jgi:hypothetical protein